MILCKSGPGLVDVNSLLPSNHYPVAIHKLLKQLELQKLTIN